MAGEAAADEINGSGICPDGFDGLIAPYPGPVYREGFAAKRIGLGEPLDDQVLAGELEP